MSQTVDVIIPTIGESITSVFIGRWMKHVGDVVSVGESVFEIDSDKASLEVPSPCAGVVTELLNQEGDEVLIGAVVARITPGSAVEAKPLKSVDKTGKKPKKAARSGPAARHAAAELGVDIGDIEGTGKGGRILRSDVEAQSDAISSPQPEPFATERTQRVKMSPMRRTIARRLVQAQQTAAILTTFNEVDLTNVKALRKRYQESFVKRHGVKLGFMSFFVKAAIESLKAFPAVNSEIDGNEVIYKQYYNIGVAVSTPRGLVVPVVRDADLLSFSEIEKTINGLAVRAREGTLQMDDFADGTFTVSNGGVFGSLMSTPIINPPQVGILGMHTIQERPVGIEGQILLRPMMYLALSYDHRIIDGREAVSFLVNIKNLVENPERILLEV